ncbi:flippase [Geobacillus sp. CAMR5420]|uniref:flippase n=1 Tax=Geobacillus sp. CAMR5420 TaxID=1482739 RepID=UPI0004A0DCF8|nr:flippase [Geobacillus sp. CAMR5420]KDE46004.1 polysaccharide biosynthesis protein [Geobacillus sp. CAMR5420]
MSTKEQYIKTMKYVIKSEVATKIIKNFSWMVSDKIFTMIVGVVVTAIVARYFGPESFGKFNYALAFVSLFTAISTLGLETLTVKSIVDKKYSEGVILCTSLFLRVIGGTILTILTYLSIRLIAPNDDDLHILVLLMSLTMVMKSFEVIEYWIQAYQKAKISSIIRIGVYVITALLKVFLVFIKGSLVQYAVIYTLDAAIISGALMVAYFKVREEITPWKFSFRYAKYILSQSWYLILSGLMVTLYMRIDQVMLGAMMPTKTEVGVYSAAVRIAEMWYFVPMAIITSFRPVIMNNKNISEDKYLQSIQLLYTIVAWLGIGFGIAILIFSKPIVLLLYGADYLKAASILSVSVWAGTFAMLGSARSIWLISEGLQSYTLLYTFVGLIVNIALNYLMIPIYGGFGAALATLVAQFSANIIALALFKKTRISSIMILKSFSPKSIFQYKERVAKRITNA